MKKLFIITVLLLSGLSSYSQSAIIHFFYGSNEMLGGETLFLLRGTENTYLGGGFSGALNKNKAKGTWQAGHINDNDLKNVVLGTISEQWCSLYLKASTGYVGKFLITYKGGLAVYDRKMEFLGKLPTNNEDFYYNKNYEVLYRPMVGLGAMYQITEDFGLEASYDSFNGATIGISAIF